jgi:ATP-binding cassette subfamily C protein CydC
MSAMVRSFQPILGLFFHRHRRPLLLGALMSAVTVLAGIALFGLSGWFITATSIAGLSSATAISFDVFAPSAGIRLLAIGRTAARYGERVTTHEATLRVLASLRERLFRGWSAPGAATLLLYRPTSLLFRLTADVDALDSLYLRVMVPALVAIVAALAVAVTFGLMQIEFGIAVGLFLIAVGLGIPLVAAQRALKPGRRRAHAAAALRSRAVDLVAGQTDLLMTGRILAQRHAIGEADRRIAEADDALNRIDTIVVAGFGLASTLLLSGALLGLAMLARSEAISPAVAALGLLVALAALEPFAALRRGALELGRTALAARRLAPRLAPQPAGPTPTVPEPGTAVRLAMASVRHANGTKNVLHDITLTLAAGERLALLGASGAGKSTLLALIAGEIAAQTGTAASQPSTLLTQRTELFQDSLRDNLRLADPTASDARLREALGSAGLLTNVNELPRGLGTVLGEGGLGLSGGQSRRLALARLLLRDRPLWLLDEPTEGLDGRTGAEVMDRLDACSQGRSMVIATHIRREAMIADRIAILDRGRIVATARRGEPEFDAALNRLRPD